MTIESSKMDFEAVEMDPYSLFTFSIKSPLTTKMYLSKVSLFFDFISIDDMPIEARIRSFVLQAKDRPNWVYYSILKFIQKQKERVERRDCCINFKELRKTVKVIL